ncbi:MAG: ParD-like antitoxin of type II toxin-antitoxin system [Candidatus Kentron sp. G]|nr:MAG: ParD-like antitoxin of type II toxin-antitoxin system [Candidatus Kentron sp. G]VFN05475.1 MAG: ParD-like antitoxin of type II toxin-antitoxin system [Candidatus Kentron sp. G]VFN07073.1 MAG: ParD-like antitoxin of type II toxin-antitoxin system [Candidatus Kentron sp. G]
MSQAVELSEELATLANIHGAVHRCSVPRQIEDWALIGKIAEENPDLPLDFALNTCLAKAEAETGDVEAYIFG